MPVEEFTSAYGADDGKRTEAQFYSFDTIFMFLFVPYILVFVGYVRARFDFLFDAREN